MQTALLTLACVAALLASSAGPASAAGLRASTVTYAWTTTEGFDAGAKAGVGTATDACENVSANRIALNNTGGFQGVGLTTNASTCAAGAWKINPLNLSAAYDMSTLVGGKIHDLSPTGADLTMSGTNASTDLFGGGRNFNGGTGEGIASAAVVPQRPNGTFLVWWKLGVASCPPASFPGIVKIGGDPGIYIQGGSGKPFLQKSPGAAVSSVACTPNVFQAWSFSWVWNGATTTLTTWQGSTFRGMSTSSIVIVQTTVLTFNANRLGGAPLTGDIDELLYFTRNVTVAERAAFAADGRSSFLSSGSWTSPAMPVSYGVPTVASLSFGNVSANRSIADVEILDGATGFRVWHRGQAINASTAITMPILSPPTLASWQVRVDLAGNGTGTPFVSSVSVGVAFPPGSSSSTGPANPTWFGYWWPWVALLGVAALVAVAGAAEHRKRKRS